MVAGIPLPCRRKAGVGKASPRHPPGNFHLNAKSTEHNFNPKETNLSHVVHHLSFGDPLPPNVLLQLPSEHQKLLSPLDQKLFNSAEAHVTHEHYIKVVTTWYRPR
eukprot:gene9886-8836_t